MAIKTVGVRLEANISQYIAAMRAASAASTGFGNTTQASMTRVGSQMVSAGRLMTVGLTAPLLVAGAGAVAMAAKFDTSFAQMVGLANVPAGEIDDLKESVLALAGETAVAPQQLADGLYFAASAGLDAAAAMDAVELAARASASGMGTTEDVVGLVASAIASYGEANITAAEATDILTSTIREGRAEPAELASTLGRVLPIASELGVSFDDVGASVALLTNVFGDTNRAVTAFQGMMVKLSSPTKQGRDALAEFGLTVADIRNAISQDGLLGAFELLTNSGITGSAQAMAKLFDDIEGRQGALALLNTDAATLNATFEALDSSSGSLDTAFGAVSETAGFKMKQAMTDLNVAMVQVGDRLLPLAADVGTAISGLVGWFTELDPAVQSVVVAFGGLLAAAGPLALVAGTLLKNWTQIAGVFGVSEGAASRTGKAFGALGLVVGGAILAWNILGEGTLNASAHINTSADALSRQTQEAYNAALAAGEATTATDALAISHLALSQAIEASADDELSEAFARLNISADEVLDTYIALRADSGQLASSQMILGRAVGATGAEVEGYLKLIRMGIGNHEILAQSLGITTTEYAAVADAMFVVTGHALEQQDEVNALALAYLDAQVRLGGMSREAVNNAEVIAGARIEANNAVPVYEEYVRQLTLLDPAAAQAALGVDGLGTAAGATLPPIEDVTAGIGELEMVAASSIDTMSDLADSWAWADVRINAFSDGLERALGTGGQWIRAHDGFVSALLGFDDAIEDASAGVDYNTEAAAENREGNLANREAVLGLADDLIALTESNIDSGMSQSEVTKDYLEGREALLDAAEAAGLNRGEVEDLIDAYGAVPELVSTAVQLMGHALAEWRIQRYLEELEDIPAEVATQIEAAIDDGDMEEAQRLLNSLSGNAIIHAEVRPKAWRGSVSTNAGTSMFSMGISASAAGRFVRGGTNMLSTLAERSGSSGDEVVLPLGDQNAMAGLLGLSEVGPRVAAAFGHMMPVPALAAVSSSPAASAPVHAGPLVHIQNIQVGSKEDAQEFARKVSAALRYARTSV